MNKKSVLCELERQKENLMACKEAKSSVRRKRKYTARKDRNENTISRINKLKFMKQKKRISRSRIQSNTSKEGKTLMKQLKRVSKIKIQSNIKKEGKALMKQRKRVSKIKIQSNNRKESKTLMKQ